MTAYLRHCIALISGFGMNRTILGQLKLRQRRWLLVVVLVVAWVSLGLMTTPAFARLSQNLDMKVLILSSSSSIDEREAVKHIKNSLDAHGVRYDHIQLTKGGRKVIKGRLPLEVNRRHGKYYGVVLTTAQLNYKNRYGSYTSALEPDQWRQLDGYRRKYAVRSVILYAFPSSELGVKRVSKLVGNKKRVMKIKNPMMSLISGLTFKGATLEGSWQYPSRLLSHSSAKPFLYLYEGTREYIGGFTQRLETGFERMVFLFSQSTYIPAANALAQLWVPWLTKGVYLGKRRAYMGLQIDDFMLNSFQWDAAAHRNPYSQARIIRSKPEDVDYIIRWQQKLGRYFLGGLHLEMTYNGAGYDRFPRTKVDHLRQYVKGKEWHFFWLNHTYSHPNLDKLSYQVVRHEVKKNYEFGRRHFRSVLDTHFSDYHLVTPEISGLFNPNAMRAFKDLHVESVTGDNSRDELRPVNKFFGRFSEKSKNGVDGIFIMPRHATEVYWDVATVAEQESQYNKVYGKEIGRNLNVDEIMAREGDKAANALLSLDPAPHMFHFPNIARIFHKGQETTLVSLWLEAALRKYHSYTKLPILNLPMKKIVDVYQARLRQRHCLKSAVLKVVKRRYAAMTLKTRKNCAVTVTSSRDFVKAPVPERFGPDRTFTLFADGTKVLRFK